MATAARQRHGLAGPFIGALADAASPRTALAPPSLTPVPSRLLFRTLPEPVTSKLVTAAQQAEDGPGPHFPGEPGERRPAAGRPIAPAASREALPDGAGAGAVAG